MANWGVEQIPNQSGKTAIVTGSNSGIGFYTALELARAGAKTILACRNLDRALQAKERIRAVAPDAVVEVARLDLGDLKSVSKFAADFLSLGQALDILVNNAGVMTPQKYLATQDGFELQFGTNHLGHFALTGRLLPALSKSEKARVVTVTSLMHRHAKIRFDDLNWKKSYNPLLAYGQSKLANAVFGIELQKRSQDRGLSIQSLVSHPGIAKTELTANTHALGPNFLTWLSEQTVHLIGQPPELGALPSLYAATSQEAQGGKLYGPRFMGGWGSPIEEKFHRSATADSTLGDRLWTVSEEVTGVRYLS